MVATQYSELQANNPNAPEQNQVVGELQKLSMFGALGALGRPETVMRPNEEIAMKLDQALVDAAIDLLERRFPTAGGIAAALYTDDGQILTSVVFEPEWGGGGLCAETGAICEAVKLDKRITASACVSRLSGDSPILILTPCGICQERLFHWGESVEVATPAAQDARRWIAKTLGEVQPYYWVNAFKESSLG